MRRIVIYLFFVAVAAAAPEPPLSSLYRPTFLWKDRSLTAGRGFLATFERAHRSVALFISCYHVLGDHPENVLGVAAISAEEKPRLISSIHYLRTKGQAVLSDVSAKGELTVFEIEDVPRRTSKLRLSARLSEPKEIVYLFAQAYGDSAPRLYRAKIHRATPAYLDYIFDDSTIELGGTSGGPVLNENGDVVGINAGGALLDQQLHGYANPMASAILTIKEALE